MKYIFLGLSFLTVGVIQSTSALYMQDTEFLAAHQWMFANEMTMFASAEAYQPAERVTREQAAKFFVMFDRVVMDRDMETLMYCVYADEASFDSTLAGFIQSACNRNLMRGSAGVFAGQDPLTKAQALTILIRSLDSSYNEDTQPRWARYFEEAQRRGLTKETNVRALDQPITRYELALLMRRVTNPISQDASSSGTSQELNELFSLLEELGLQRD